ncbi:MAG TPA: SAM-dependent chlorinase/fluorinase, partial [Thermoanaerobaculia bacterium]|nr:SAM-dependent chlorinase/fluorinase [Thermoanaerobaculia bacterium]
MRRIALMTDFGTRDPYVAAMKGVLASRTDAPIVDLTHEIAPFDVLEGAWFLRTVVPYWPEGTIFVCVVDPGVGTERRIVAVEEGGRVFLAPDNGLLSLLSFVIPSVS